MIIIIMEGKRMSVTGNKLRRVNTLEEEEHIVISIPKSKIYEGGNWIRERKGTLIMDTPLWVLISLGLQSAKVPEWTPVSESQPEEDGEYLVTWTTSRSKRPLLEICEYSCGEWNIDNGSAYSDAQVIAWMPLPKPYRESR